MTPAFHTLVLNFGDIQGDPMEGAIAYVSYDRDVRSSDGTLIPSPAATGIAIEALADATVQVVASDDPDLMADSQGFGIRVRLVWTQAPDWRRQSKSWLAQVHVADDDTVNLSDHLATVAGSGVAVLQGPKGDPGPAGPAGTSSIDPSSFELRGTGSPVGVVTPPNPGTFYTDVAGTNGAWRWISTGTTATSWIVVNGDTGSRDASGNLNAGWAPNPNHPHVFLRRVNSTVFFECRLEVVDGGSLVGVSRSTVTNILDIPSGFQPESFVPLGSAMAGSVVNCYGVVADFASAGVLQLNPWSSTGSWNALDRLSASGSWSTAQAWPTTLPGT